MQYKIINPCRIDYGSVNTKKTNFPDNSNCTQNYTARLLNIQAHYGEMPIKLDTAAVLALYSQIFCRLNAVNTNLLCVTAKVCVFRSRKRVGKSFN